MARLVLSLDGQVLAEYNMSKERYTVGRLPDNDVRIDNPAVSGHHSLIINILNDSFLEDLNSTNGTYVNGKLIKKHALQNGDLITIGHHQLRFVDQQVDDVDQDEFEKTMVINPRSQDRAALDQVKQAVNAVAGGNGAASGIVNHHGVGIPDPGRAEAFCELLHGGQGMPSAAPRHRSGQIVVQVHVNGARQVGSVISPAARRRIRQTETRVNDLDVRLAEPGGYPVSVHQGAAKPRVSSGHGHYRLILEPALYRHQRGARREPR